MSKRGTPGPSSYGQNGPYSPAVSTTTSIRDPSSSRRPTRSGSLVMSETPERRGSSLSGVMSRKASQASFSGTSTPTRRPLRKLLGKDGKILEQDEKDWAGMEPDDVFRRLPVNEVKKVEAKMRSDAMNKQSELRSMVGTRYRDLLTSATQITSLHSSSLRLSSSLKTVSQSCSNPADTSTSHENESMGPSDNEDVMNTLPVAAHMKLLLDAPEALYAYLARHAFLDAAFLWLITRVVKESLSSMSEEVSSPYLPLLQKQWETLTPFRAQIVHRATASMRARDMIDPKTLAETLLAIILLDNLPLSDALSLFLSQRTKTLRDILVHVSEPSSPSISLSPPIRKRRNSRLPARANERDEIGIILTEAAQSLLDTVTTARAVFDRRRRLSNSDSLIEEMIRLVQVGEPVQAGQSNNLTRQTSHQRRTSRLVSISAPMPKLSSSLGGPPVSTSGILQTLSSSQILLRHLPTTITGFTPFINPASPPNLSEALQKWRDTTTRSFSEAMPSWLAALTSVQDIWHVRSALSELLEEGDFEDQIRKSSEGEWETRVKAVWAEKLDSLVNDVEVKVREAGEKIRINGSESDTKPESFLFSDLSFPTAPAAPLVASSSKTSLPTFISSVKKRTAFRTPLVDTVLSSLEQSAMELKADMAGLPASLYVEYGKLAQSALDRMVKVLERVLESMGSSRGDGQEGIDAELFVGRVALFLARKSGFLTDVVGEGGLDTGPLIDALLNVHASSTLKWREKAVASALKKVEPIFDPMLGANEIRAEWQGPMPSSPSDAVMVSLHYLVTSTRQLGIPKGITLSTIQELVSAYVGAAKSLEGWNERQDEKAVQAAVDLGFLLLLNGENVEKDPQIQNLLSKIPDSFPSSFIPNLPDILAESLRRTQLILSPLLQHLPSTILPLPPSSSIAKSDARGGLLRFGPPLIKGGGIGTEFKSPLAVAKPGKRFGLLSIASCGATSILETGR